MKIHNADGLYQLDPAGNLTVEIILKRLRIETDSGSFEPEPWTTDVYTPENVLIRN
jgi:hypothetical protein